MDTPQVTPDLLTMDFDDCDACFGPAEDGGFWALGLAEPDPELLRGVPMSTPTTGAVQRERLVAGGTACARPAASAGRRHGRRRRSGRRHGAARTASPRNWPDCGRSQADEHGA